jgi:hypothetical protein
MMAVVYLYSLDGTLIALDATTDVSRTRSGSVTKNTVQDGSVIADHYHSDLPTISFSGLLTNSKLPDRSNPTPTIENFCSLVDELMDSGQTFTLYGTSDRAIPDLLRCVILNYSVSRSVSNFNSLEVEFQLSSIDIGDRARLDTITKTPSVATQGQLDSKTSTGTGTKTEIGGVGATQAYLEQTGGKILPVGG